MNTVTLVIGRQLTLFLFAVGLPIGLAGSTNSLTLETAVNLAMKNRPEIVEALANWNAAEQRAIQAGVRPNPRLIVGGESLPVSSATGSGDYLIGLSQKIRSGKKVRLTKAVAVAERERAALLYRAAERAVGAKAASAFATGLYAQESERLYAAQIRLLETNAMLVKVSVDAGDQVKEAEEIAHALLDHERLDHSEAVAIRDLAYARLAVAVGVERRAVTNLNGTLARDLGVEDLETGLDSLMRLPEFLAVDSEADVLKLQAELERSSRIPSLDLDVLYRRQQGNRRDGFDFEAAISLPLFDKRKAAAEAFEQDAKAAQARARQLRVETLAQINRLRTELSVVVRRARHIRSEIIPHREQIERRRRLMHTAGEISRLDLVQAQLDLLEERRHHLVALREMHRLWNALRRWTSAAAPSTSEQ